MKFAVVALCLTALGSGEASAVEPFDYSTEIQDNLVFPAPKTDPTYQRCNFDYGFPYSFPCKNPKYPNCIGMKHGVSWGRCFERDPVETLAIDPRYQRCRMDFGNDHGARSCQDPLYPDCINEFCYARQTLPQPLVKDAPRPDPSGQNCAHDYNSKKWHVCKNPDFPICEGMIHGKQWGRCMSASTKDIRVKSDPKVVKGVTYENELIISHNDTDPKLVVYTDEAIKDVKTWQDAYAFCQAKGRRLPWRYEWCNGKWSHYKGQDVWGGRRAGPGYEWTAVADHHVPGTLLQLADTLDDNGDREVCKTWVPSPPVYKVEDFDPFCKKPDNCEGDKCDFECPSDAKEGFYPDPNNCKAVCYCSESGGSFWEQVTKDDKEIWDPWCGNSRALNRGNIPLGGMTGGCMRKEYYVDDQSYCDGSQGERKLWRLQPHMIIKAKKPEKLDAVMCVKTAKFHHSQINPTCAAAWGDPHMVTYDGLRYSCQGQGDHILATSLDSDFELQGKFQKPLDASIKGATILTGFHLRTGNPNEPDIEFDFQNRWHRRWWIGGEENKFIDWKYSQLGTQTTGSDKVQYFAARGVRMFYFPESEIQLKVTYNFQSRKRLGFYINIELCLPDTLKEERIIGMLGSPDDHAENDWMNREGKSLKITDTKWEGAFNYCKENWCIEDPNRNNFHNQFTCDDEYDDTLEQKVRKLDKKDPLYALCGGNPECMADGLAGGTEVAAHTKRQQKHLKLPDLEVEEEEDEKVEEEEQKMKREEEEDPEPAPVTPSPTPAPTPTPAPKPVVKKLAPKPVKKGSGSGDPHFKTWTGDKFDYHGECDLVLVDHPSFNNGQGLRVHVRTTQVKYFSFISNVAVQIGDDILEFDNDIENFKVNGFYPGPNKKHHKTLLGGFVVRRDTKALSIRLHDEGSISRHTHKLAKIDLHTRKNGFPAVIVDSGHTDVFKGSLGLMGDWATGKKIGRDGQTEFVVNGVEDEDGATAFALEWQVRNDEPLLFEDHRIPQFPQTCLPPAKRPAGRLGADSLLRKEAEEACAHWKEDKSDCIFDVIATADVLVAQEGHIIHIE